MTQRIFLANSRCEVPVFRHRQQHCRRPFASSLIGDEPPGLQLYKTVHPPLTTCAAATSAVVDLAQSYVSENARRSMFTPAKEQYPEADARLVSGRLPSWLSGSFLLNGCGNFQGMMHLFDGYACLTRISLDGGSGRVSASQRFLETDAYSSFRRTGRMQYREFLTPVPADGPMGRAGAVADNLMALMSGGRAFTDNASVSVTHLPNGDLLALSEARTAAYLVDALTLAVRRQVHYGDGLPGDLTTAHPKMTPDGRLVNFSRSLPFGGFHVFVQDPESLKRRQIAFIADRDPLAPCWVHDMALTASHLIIVEPPLYMSMPSLVLGTPRQYAFMDWRPEEGTRVHVVALDGSGVVTHTTGPLFTFHFANAFERATSSSSGSQSGTSLASEICVDFSVYDDPEILNDLYLDRLNDFPGKDVSPCWLRRLTIPLTDATGNKVGPTTLSAPAPLIGDEASYGNFFEFPAVNAGKRGQPYRYVYGTAASRPTNMGNALARHDLETGSSKLWHEAGGAPTEPAFVPRPGALSEDDGVLLAVVARSDGGSHLVVLDGADMREVARLELPFTVPYRFHGTFVAEDAV